MQKIIIQGPLLPIGFGAKFNAFPVYTNSDSVRSVQVHCKRPLFQSTYSIAFLHFIRTVVTHLCIIP